MSKSRFQAGDRVRIVNIPEWLLRDLPEEDQERLKAKKGTIIIVHELMPHGYLWLENPDGVEGFSLQPSDVEPD